MTTKTKRTRPAPKTGPDWTPPHVLRAARRRSRLLLGTLESEREGRRTACLEAHSLRTALAAETTKREETEREEAKTISEAAGLLARVIVLEQAVTEDIKARDEARAGLRAAKDARLAETERATALSAAGSAALARADRAERIADGWEGIAGAQAALIKTLSETPAEFAGAK